MTWPGWSSLWLLQFLFISRFIISFNTLRPRQYGRHFADDPFKRIFLNETLRISIKISLNFLPKGPINYIPMLVQIMAWRRRGDKPLSEPMMVSLLTHICITRPQWVNTLRHDDTHMYKYIYIYTYRSSLFQVMACYLLGAKPLFEQCWHTFK